MVSLPERDRHQKAEDLWLRWSVSRRKNERDDLTVELWRLCRPEIWDAAKEIARKFGRGGERHVTVPEWRLRHGLDAEDIEHTAFPAVRKAAKSFDPCRGTFQTYARNFILGELRRSIMTQDALNRADVQEGAGDLDQEYDEWVSDEDRDRMSWLFGSGSDARRPHLRTLEPESLNALFKWLNENAERAIREHGYYEFHDLRSWVASVCFLKKLLKGTLRPKDRAAGPLGMRVTKIEEDGKTRDLTAPLTARALRGLRGRRFSERDMARLLGMSQKGYRGLRDRIEERGLDVLDDATLQDLDAVVRGKRRGPKRKK